MTVITEPLVLQSVRDLQLVAIVLTLVVIDLAIFVLRELLDAETVEVINLSEEVSTTDKVDKDRRRSKPRQGRQSMASKPVSIHKGPNNSCVQTQRPVDIQTVKQRESQPGV